MRYAFTVVRKENPDEEITGVVDCPSIELAAMKLLSLGFVVREIRTARAEDLTLEKLRDFRRKLTSKVTLHRPVEEHFSGYALLILLLVVLMVAYFWR